MKKILTKDLSNQTKISSGNFASYVIDCLKKESIDFIFTVPAEHIFPLLHAAFTRNKINVVNAKLEISAGFMSLIYSRITRKVGVLLLASGPGILGAISPIAQAMTEGDPLLVISTVPPRNPDRRNYMHKLLRDDDQLQVLEPITKKQFRIENPKNVSQIISEAFSISRSGRPGPVYIEIPVEILEIEEEFGEYINRSVEKPTPTEEEVTKVLNILKNSRFPSIIVGRGVYLSNAEKEVVKLAEALGAPMVTTIMGKGIVPPDHPLYAGVFAGASGNSTAIEIINKSDVVLSIGNRFSEMGTGRFNIKINGKLIHVNVYGGDIGTLFPSSLGIISDAKIFIEKILEELKDKKVNQKRRNNTERIIKELWEKENEVLFNRNVDDEKSICPWDVVNELIHFMKKDAILIGDVGAHRIETFLMPIYSPGSYITTTSYVGMGLAIPGAVAASIVYPEKQIIAVVGDGGFLMTGLEISTAVQYRTSPKILIFNDSSYRILHVYEKAKYGEEMPRMYDLPTIDFSKIAEGMGAKGISISNKKELKSKLTEAFQYNNGPVVIDIKVNPDLVPKPFQPIYKAEKISNIKKNL